MFGAALLTTTADPPCTSSSAVLLGCASSASGTPLSSLPGLSPQLPFAAVLH